MIDLLRAASEERSDHAALITPRGETTYGQLLAAAERAGANLAARGIVRLAILDDDPAQVLALYAGSALAGVEACIYPLAANREAIDEYRERFDHEHLATSRAELLADGAIDSSDLLADHGAARITTTPAAKPLMVMTTGTTSGSPRAVQHDWDRVLASSARIHRTPEQRWLLAYGLNQFGGLQILIHVVAAQATLIVGDSFQPRDGLVAMRHWDVTHASGTPTFWRFLLVEIHSDGGPVPPLVQVTMSGEAIPEALLQQVRETFPTAKLSQIYAATEFGQAVTVRDGVAGLPTRMLETSDDLDFKVVDGELWVRSTASMLGYYKEERVDPDSWRPTGDLVEIAGDRVQFRGRRNEVINVGGVKVHPLPIEARIGQVPGVALVRAFGRANAMVGAIVAVEIVLAPGHEHEEVEANIRAACADLPPAARPRSIRFVQTIDITGNKINRGSPL